MTDEKKLDSIELSTSKEDSPWYAKDIEAVIRPQTRKMLQEYAGVSEKKLTQHIEEIRGRAWEMAPWPSVGALTWLNPYILLHEAHETILSKLKGDASILDCGCFFSPDLRYLAYEGAPTNRMYSFDIQNFWDLAFDFYNDKDRWQGKFIQADGMKELSESPLGDLKAKIDIIWSPKFLHIWDRSRQIEVAARLVELLKPVPGSMFVGSQNGHPSPLEMPIGSRGGVDVPGIQKTFFLGNADTIKEMWNEVAEQTGTKWNVESRLFDMRTIGLHQDDGSEYKKMTGYNLQWTATLLEPPSKRP